jgi:uncharacterized Zn finger protein (UPF0148 family)
VTITVTIAIILFSCNAWDDYKVRYKDSIRSVEIENVERLRKCKTPENGYKTYKCPECGTIRYVPFTCKCRLCTSCGTKAANEWAEKIHQKLLKVPHRHVVFTIPDKLREVFKNPDYQKVLFAASKITMEEMISSSNKKSKKKIKLKIGMIQVLQTYGADMKWNPHVHCIVTEGGFDRQWNWIHTYYMPYKFWRKKWQYMLLTMLKKEMPTCRENSDFINLLFKNYDDGFVMNGKRRFEKRDGWNMARYIGRYVKHPPIAESRIMNFDGNQVTYWYEDSETKQKKTVAMDKFEFIRLLLSHVPEKNFKIVRYVGIYSRRGYRHRQTEFHEGEIILNKRSWREEIKKTFQYDPLICPYCETEMELIGICYEGTASYPTEEPKPVEPPPDYRYRQQDRIRFITSVIKNNQNGRGVSIETVISEAAKIGMNREQAITYIEHLKLYGSAYEPNKGEIRCAF